MKFAMKAAASLAMLWISVSAKAAFVVRDAGPATVAGTIELRGMQAGAFDPKTWRDAAPPMLPDVRQPFLAPKAGAFRNIYAPSIVQTPQGFALFYGGWDGTPTGNDRIYRRDTRDFITFTDSQIVIEHNVFQHVCNVNATRSTDGCWAMMCTAYPDAHGNNKPITFFGPDGRTWNGSRPPHPASLSEIVSLSGYPGYADADINGVNVMLREAGQYRMYFADFHHFGKTYRASSTNGREFKLDGAVLDGALMVNDVKKFKVDGADCYLMGLHHNANQIFYSLSNDGMKFPTAKLLAEHGGAADRYMVAVGFVVSGREELPGRRLLGVLYGAGATGNLSENRIFALWLQKRAVVQIGSETIKPFAALGPDRQLFKSDKPFVGTLSRLAEDGKTLIDSANVTLRPGRAYQLKSAGMLGR